jgi:hypothetical protein
MKNQSQTVFVLMTTKRYNLKSPISIEGVFSTINRANDYAVARGYRNDKSITLKIIPYDVDFLKSKVNNGKGVFGMIRKMIKKMIKI